MCDPLTIGIVSAAGAVASAGASYVTQSNAINSQQRANAAYNAYQKQQRDAELLRQEGLRQRAEGERQKTLAEVTAEAQGDKQAAEAERLTKEYGAVDPKDTAATQAVVNNALLSGQDQGGTVFQDDFAKRINTATQDARKRIQALATMQSYGGSQFGLGTENALAFERGNQNLKLTNNMRQGSMGAYGAAQNVAPITNPTVNNPWGGIASSLAGIAGNNFGTAFRKA